jgi:hypothetical protein
MISLAGSVSCICNGLPWALVHVLRCQTATGMTATEQMQHAGALFRQSTYSCRNVGRFTLFDI